MENNYADHALLSSEAEADAYVKANDLGSSVTEIESMLAGASQRLLHKPRVERVSVRPLIKKLQVAEQEGPSKQQAAVSEGFNGAKSFHDASSPHSGENLGPPAHTEMIAGDSLQQEIKQAEKLAAKEGERSEFSKTALENIASASHASKDETQ